LLANTVIETFVVHVEEEFVADAAVGAVEEASA